MSNPDSSGSVRILGLLVIIAGAILAVAGVVTYATVSSKLSEAAPVASRLGEVARFNSMRVL